MTKETKRTSSSSRAITTLMELAIQGTRTAATHRGHPWKKWELSLLPLPQVDSSWPPTISVPIHMLLIPTLDQAHHSPRAAWDTQLPPSSLHSTHIRHIGTEPCWSLSVHCCSCCRAGCSPLREPGVDHENVLYNHIFTMSSSQVPPVVTDWGGSFQVVPKFGVRLEKKSASTVVSWVCYFHSLLDRVQTDQA